MQIIFYVILALLGLGGLTYYRARTIQRPDNVNNGSIKPCPATPNCVSTLDTDETHAIAPITYAGSLDAARAQLVTVLRGLPKTEVITEEPTYVYAESRSPTMGFPDDLEFVFDDDAKHIQLRSAARMGKGDLGKNRERIEEIRRRFAQLESQSAHAV
jgi:uncharacterized protein (DUF1499 family)